MYAILGATGNTGGVIARRLLSGGEHVRAIGRSGERLQSLVDLGAEAFTASVEDSDSLAQAFEGARAVYSIIPPRVDVEDYRAFQDRAGRAIAAAIEAAGVQYVVQLSSVGASHPSGTGPVAGLHAMEQRLNGLGINVVHLRPGWFMENLLEMIPGIREMGVIASPTPPDLPTPMIATRDIGEAAAELLLGLDFDGSTTRELLGARDLTLAEATRIVGAAIGRPDLAYVQITFEQAEQGLLQMGVSPAVADVYLELYRAHNEGLLAAEEPRSAANTTPTTLELFAEEVFAPAYEEAAQG